MRRAILGTAGHIDHGKTALVAALTGVDTDRLPEEKARGITIDLGFAELAGAPDLRLGVVDVPGHEDLIRTMVAGATGMDLVLMVVAADEGIMPQTREHFDIVRLLAVPRLVVALTKSDLVDEEWLAMVADDVEAWLAATSFAGSPVIPTSVKDGAGLDELRRRLVSSATESRPRERDDWARLPVDRSFTVAGMGTVVTGTLWSGSLKAGERARLLPSGSEARIRSLQVHGRDTDEAQAGERTAVALAGMDRRAVGRGDVLVTDQAWCASRMLTVRARLLDTASRPLEHGSRVRALHGTTEVMARCVVMDGPSTVGPGEEGWVQLRLEEPLVARGGDSLILRAYSPPVTLGGGTVAEACAPKRRRLRRQDAARLGDLLAADPAARLSTALEMAGWSGLVEERLPQDTGLTVARLAVLVDGAVAEGSARARGRAYAASVVAEAEAKVAEALTRGHAEEPLRPSVPLDRLRRALPSWAGPGLADAVIQRMEERGTLEAAPGGARRPGFLPAPTPDQAGACADLRSLYAAAGLAPPFLAELPDTLAGRPDLAQLLRVLEEEGTLVTVDDGLLVAAEALEAASRAISTALGGRTGLGPADFREVIPVSRRHLMPLLAWFDGRGVTLRRGPVRDVPPSP